MEAKILLIDDDTAFRGMLKEALTGKGYSTLEAGSAEEGIELAEKNEHDLTLLDVKLPGMSGIDALEHLREKAPDTDIIVMTAFSSRDSALDAMQRGAYDYFTKPFSLAEMEVVIRRALEKRKLQEEVKSLRKTLARKGPVGEIIGQSKPMQQVVELIESVAGLDVNVLIIGETGTGKELIADTIHALSKRASGPFVKLNCAAIPENLLESELFGHEKGAFTGATTAKQGKFELAKSGTILLDEIGDMPLHLQPKLLRAVEQKQAERLGGTKPILYDVRIVAATNQDLNERVAEKEFRSDLYYRLNVAAIHLPPLRERKDDLPLLADHFIKKINDRLLLEVQGITSSAMRLLYDYDWPGNIRQLANTLERATIFCKRETLDKSDIARALQHAPDEKNIANITTSLKSSLMEYERELIEAALHRNNGVQTEAAAQLGISAKNLWNKLKKHNIDPNNLRT